MEREDDMSKRTSKTETPILYALADEVGVPAHVLRVDFMDAHAKWATLQTSEASTLFYNETAAASIPDGNLTLTTSAPSAVVRVEAAQYGLLPTCPDTATPGFWIVISGAGADDDVFVTLQLEGVLRDNVKKEYKVRGERFIPFPGVFTANSALKWTLKNSTATDISVGMFALSRLPKASVAEAARHLMAKDGVPVGSAFGGLMERMVDVSTAVVDANNRVREAQAGALAKGDGARYRGLQARARDIGQQAGRVMAHGLGKDQDGFRSGGGNAASWVKENAGRLLGGALGSGGGPVGIVLGQAVGNKVADRAADVVDNIRERVSGWSIFNR